MPKITWNVQLEDGPHTVELNHGYFSGKRVIHLDGVLVERTHKLWHLLLDVGSSHAFQINDHRFVIDIQINGMTPYYHLAVDGRLIEPTEVAFQVDPLHWLRWLAAISLIIGLLTMTVLELFRQPDHGPLEIVPPALRDPLTCVLGAAIPFGAAGFALVVIIDIYRSSRAKRTGRWALFLLSVAIYVLNMGFWARGVQGYIGLLRTLSLGVPPWSIVVPVLCLASMIALAWRPRGVYILLLPLGFVLLLLGLKLFDMSASLLEAAGLRHGFGAYLSLALSVAYQLLATGLAFRDQQEGTPLDAWHARLVYLGTYRHLQALYQLARQNRWDILGPNQETGSAVLVRGIRNGRQIFIASNRLGLSVSVSSLEELWVLVLEWLPALDPSWAERLWPFSRAEARRRPQRALADVARKGHYLDARGKRRTFYLFPPQGETVDGESLAALGQALAAGRTFLRPRTEVWSPGGTLELFQPKVFAIRAGAQEIAALLDWMIQVCQVMEACRMAEFVDNDRGSAELDL